MKVNCHLDVYHQVIVMLVTFKVSLVFSTAFLVSFCMVVVNSARSLLTISNALPVYQEPG